MCTSDETHVMVIATDNIDENQTEPKFIQTKPKKFGSTFSQNWKKPKNQKANVPPEIIFCDSNKPTLMNIDDGLDTF